MRSKLFKELPSILLLVAMVIIGWWAYPHLPQTMPSHWNYKGEIDRYTGKLAGVIFMPAISVGIYLLLLVLPFLDPRRENYKKFSGTYQKIKFGMIVFFFVLYSVIILFSLGYISNMTTAMLFIMSMLFMLLGNYLGKIRQNYFVGIKVPWTLADEEVWNKTHRLGGKLWVATGVIGLGCVWLPQPTGSIIFFGTLMVSSIATIIYSYFIYAKKRISM